MTDILKLRCYMDETSTPYNENEIQTLNIKEDD
jgi:hypothetical protein